jgi:methionine biosynthesis protein MetW
MPHLPISGLPRTDYEPITDWITPESRVLDLGCGDGALLQRLKEMKQVQGVGIEKDGALVQQALNKGLTVMQDDLASALADYAPQSWDWVVLNQTLQATENPVGVLRAMLRVGKQVIVGFPNFGHWQVRLWFLLKGRMPESKALPYHWYDTPNIHLFTIRDFTLLCQEEGILRVSQRYQLLGQWQEQEPWPGAANLLGTHAIYRLQGLAPS